MNILSYLSLNRRPGTQQLVIPVRWWASVLAIAVAAAVIIASLDTPGWAPLAAIVLVNAAGLPLYLLMYKNRLGDK